MTKTKKGGSIKNVHSKIANELKRYRFAVFTAFGILVALSTAFAINIYFSNRLLPRTSIANVRVGLLSKRAATAKLQQNITPPEKITILASTQTFEIPLKEIDFSYDFEKSTDDAVKKQQIRNGVLSLPVALRRIANKEPLLLVVKIDEQKLDNFISVIAGQTYSEPVYPEIQIIDNKPSVTRGEAGKEPRTQDLKRTILEKLSQANYTPTAIAYEDIDPTLTDEQIVQATWRAENILQKELEIKSDEKNFLYTGTDLVKLLNPAVGYDDKKIDELISKIQSEIKRPPQNAIFRFEEGAVKEFTPAKDGLDLNQAAFKKDLVRNLFLLEIGMEEQISFGLPLIKTPPAITTQEVNNLGIKELLGRGESHFRGSIPSRIHNISLASSKFNGVLVAPGETLSFNGAVGDVSALTGYKQAYIIKDGKTVLGDGGGLCQVSTTLFRATLASGLPIIERRAHSYRVGYYEQGFPPGLDATVYSPTTDFKIKNDTPAHILIQTSIDIKTATLVFEIYGTSDGRVATTTKPIVSKVVAPPEDLYVDDPTLPTGQVKQIEYKAWGSTVIFNYLVQGGGQAIYEKTFTSVYRPWQAVFLRGTAPTQ